METSLPDGGRLNRSAELSLDAINLPQGRQIYLEAGLKRSESKNAASTEMPLKSVARGDLLESMPQARNLG